MSAHASIETKQTVFTVAVVGNPNTGKSTLFNALTGFRQRVGNYPGVTVGKRSGRLRSDDGPSPIELIDLPGAYSLSAQGQDEAIVMDVLLGRVRSTPPPDAVLIVMDATHLRRNLFFATQVLELGKPAVVALNMMDEAEAAGLDIDANALGRELRVPVVPVVANRGEGLDRLAEALHRVIESDAPRSCVVFPPVVCEQLDELARRLAERDPSMRDGAGRAEALQALLAPGGFYERRIVERLGEHVREELQRRREAIERTGESVVELEGRVRYAWIDRVIEQVVKQKGRAGAAMPVADRILTHPVLGLLIFLVLMGICFESIYGWAAPVMDGMERGFSALGTWLGGMLPAGPLRSLVADGIVAGVGAVLVFLPQILILFLFIAILEDCGYMARAAFVMDRWMSRLGLSGQSFIPLLSCFACAVPGILATRTIDNRRDRFVTILVAPLMTCSARIPVYVLMIGALIPPVSWLGGWLNLQGLVLLGLYALGMVTAIVVALILKRTLFPGEGQAFLMELPAYRRPSLKHVVYRMYSQGKEFCVSAGTIIFAVTVVIWALGYYPRPRAIADRYEARRAALRAEYAAVADDEAGEELQRRLAEIDREESGAYFRQSFLARMGRWIEPAVRPLGWDWRIGTAAIASFPAREVVVATMGTIYNLGDEADEQSQGLREKLKEATWPDGRAVFNPAVALSIMVFFALCCQCGGTLATIRRETRSWRWPVFTFTYMTVLAYIGALVTYQVTIRLI